MKRLITALFIAGLILYVQGLACAATATATFSAVIPSINGVSLFKETNSACASADLVKFDKFDSVDKTGGDPGYMYAPYRSLTGKNWHVAMMTANGTGTVSLKVDALLTGIDKSKLKVWFGGFYLSGSGTAIAGTTSADWEAMGSTKTATGPVTGQCPLSYQLNVADTAAGTYGGAITITLTQ